ncbi:MAG TPA: RNA chaperone Hfq [Xanthobacteraceae bacterium]|jgi:host factor-I protein
MPSRDPNRLQNEFLSYLIKTRTPTTVFLLSGIALKGVITSFDEFCISLERDGQLHAVYKQEVSVISASSPVTLWEDPGKAHLRKARPPSRPAPGRTPRKVVVERRRLPSRS